jgi:hypothetical protein
VLEIFVKSRHQKPSREVERRNGRNIQKNNDRFPRISREELFAWIELAAHRWF